MAGKCVMVTFLRHGQSEGNANNTDRQIDDRLTSLGCEQAKAAGEELANTRIDTIWSSDLIRARDTAQAVIDAHSTPGLTLVEHQFIRERESGDVARACAQRGDSEGHFYEINGFSSWRHLSHPYRWHTPRGGGESLDTVQLRAAKVLYWIRDRDPSVCAVLPERPAQLDAETEIEGDGLIEGVPHLVMASHNVFLSELYELLNSGGRTDKGGEHKWTRAHWQNAGWARFILWFPEPYDIAEDGSLNVEFKPLIRKRVSL